jgi:hypothetical protein
MEARLTPRVVAIAATVYCPDAYISRATWSLWPLSTDGRPPRRPRARAAASPALVRSRMRSRSNSAKAAKTWKTSLPPGGVDLLLETPEPDPAVGQVGDGVDQVAEGAAEAVEFPDDQGVAGPQLVQDLFEGGPVGAGAAGGLGEHPVAAGALEGVDLELGVLVGGGDAGIAEQVSHGGTVSQSSDSGGCVTLISDTGSGNRWGALVAGERWLSQKPAVSDS